MLKGILSCSMAFCQSSSAGPCHENTTADSVFVNCLDLAKPLIFFFKLSTDAEGRMCQFLCPRASLLESTNIHQKRQEGKG